MVNTTKTITSDLEKASSVKNVLQRDAVKKITRAVHMIWILHIAMVFHFLLFFSFFPADTMISKMTDAKSDWNTPFQNGLFISASFLLISLIYNGILINVQKSRIADLTQEAQP